jgi:hypothetical protein
MLKVRLSVAFLGLAMISSVVLQAQTEAVPSAPKPTQILTAKKVFISNAGGDFNTNSWSGTPDRTYNEFYAAIMSWGRYELVSTPGESDMVLDIRLEVTPSTYEQFRLVLLDPKTHIALWTLSENFVGSGLKNTRDKKFSESINKLVGDLKVLVAQPATASNPK